MKEGLGFSTLRKNPVRTKDDFMEFFHDYGMNLIEAAFLLGEQIDMFQSDFHVVADLMVHRRLDPNYRPEPWVLKHAEAHSCCYPQ